MPQTVPNQRTIYIHRKMPTSGAPFLTIKLDHLFNAYRDLNATGLVLYLYLASNKDGYNLAFSPQAVENSIGMPRSTCRDQFNKLVDKGYLVQKSPDSNIYNFYETPQNNSVTDAA